METETVENVETVETETVSRFRTIKGAADYYKTLDPETSLTESMIRNLAKTGKIPCSKIGKKYLITIDALEKYLRGEEGKEKARGSLQKRLGWHIT